MAKHLTDGAWAEEMAAVYLKKETEYQILERNWRYSHSEIDIVCSFRTKLILVEVKYRKSNYFGDPEDSVSVIKQRKMQEAAEEYMKLNPKFSEVFFDIISITGPQQNASLMHFRDAFFPS